METHRPQQTFEVNSDWLYCRGRCTSSVVNAERSLHGTNIGSVLGCCSMSSGVRGTCEIIKLLCSGITMPLYPYQQSLNFSGLYAMQAFSGC